MLYNINIGHVHSTQFVQHELLNASVARLYHMIINIYVCIV